MHAFAFSARRSFPNPHRSICSSSPSHYRHSIPTLTSSTLDLSLLRLSPANENYGTNHGSHGDPSHDANILHLQHREDYSDQHSNSLYFHNHFWVASLNVTNPSSWNPSQLRSPQKSIQAVHGKQQKNRVEQSRGAAKITTSVQAVHVLVKFA